MLDALPPRERQIVDVLYLKGEATAGEVRDALPDELSGSAVRAMLTRLDAKGYVTRRDTPNGFVYAPAVPQAQAKKSALNRIVDVFFNGSPAGAATALLGMGGPLKAEELDELEKLIADARKGDRS